MGLSIRVKDVQPSEDMRLLVTFENGVKKLYDTKQLLAKFPCYERLKDKAFLNLYGLIAAVILLLGMKILMFPRSNFGKVVFLLPKTEKILTF